MIRAAEPAYPYVEKHLPRKWKRFIEHYTSGTRVVNHESNWKRLLTSLIRIMVIYSVIIIAILILSFQFLVPLIRGSLPGFWVVVCRSDFVIDRTFFAGYRSQEKPFGRVSNPVERWIF